jgi:hypothetical protein
MSAKFTDLDASAELDKAFGHGPTMNNQHATFFRINAFKQGFDFW